MTLRGSDVRFRGLSGHPVMLAGEAPPPPGLLRQARPNPPVDDPPAAPENCCRGRPNRSWPRSRNWVAGAGSAWEPAFALGPVMRPPSRKRKRRQPTSQAIRWPRSPPAREDQPINAIPKKRQLKWRQIAPDVAICLQLRGTVNRSRPTVGANRTALLFPGHSYCSTRPISQAPPKAC